MLTIIHKQRMLTTVPVYFTPSYKIKINTKLKFVKQLWKRLTEVTGEQWKQPACCQAYCQ
jgi:hypothetical protein